MPPRGTGPRVGLGSYRPLTDEFLSRAAQLGVTDILAIAHDYDGVESALPLGASWRDARLERMRDRARAAGLELFAIETMPVSLYTILLDDHDRAEKTRVVADTIRAMGRVGIHTLGYSGHLPEGAIRTDREVPVRGGALASAFDRAALENPDAPRYGREYTESELWERYEAFLEAVLPVAEEAGVTLAAHPADPPLERLHGVPLLLSSRENFDRALDLVPSPNHQLKLGMGCWSAMGEDLPDVIRHYAGDIAYAHARDVVGTVPAFRETFLDDPDGNYDATAAIRALRDTGFQGVLTPDHVPFLAGETDWEFGGRLGRTWTAGYLAGLLDATT